MKHKGALLAAFVLCAGCGKGNFNTHRGVDAVLTYPLEAKVTTLDPGKVQDVDMTDVLDNVFEGLVAYDEKNMLIGRLAERWEVVDGGLTYVFHLRKATFSDGTPMRAADFKRSWERNLSKELASPVATNYLGAIRGAPEVADGRAKELTGVKVIDDLTLRVTLDKPRAYFLGNLTYPCAFVLSPKAPTTEIRTADEAVGTGPFRLAKVQEDAQVDLAAYEGYWGGKPKLARIVRPVVLDPATRLSGFRNGLYDEISVARNDLEGVNKDPALAPRLRFEPRPAINYFLLNQRGYAPFRDLRVRKALALALDRRTTVETLLPGEIVANGLVAPGVPGYQADYKGLPYDVKSAQALLAAAGFPGGKGMPTLELAYRSGMPEARLACEAAATAWRKDLGVPVAPRALEWGSLLQQRNKDRLQMAFLSWYADYLDPQNFLSLLLTSTSKLNHDGYSNPEFDRLCDQADVDPDAGHRIGLYQQAERIAVEDAARLPLYFVEAPILVSTRVRGMRTNLFGLMPQTTTSVGG